MSRMLRWWRVINHARLQPGCKLVVALSVAHYGVSA
jgi:hypothetical protein